ncbi:MAG: hypothetical protein AAF830_05980 [Pseudomonadota bacterium]
MQTIRPIMLFATLFPSLLLSMAETLAAQPQAEPASQVTIQQPQREVVAEARTTVPVDAEADFDALCGDVSVSMIGSTRRVTEVELDGCARLGVPALTEVQLGLNGLILAQAAGLGNFGVDLRELFLASAAFVPQDDACTLVPNPNQSWSDVGEDLPSRPIRLYADQRSTNGFIDLALVEGARQIDCLAELEVRDPKAFERAIMTRRDAAWLEPNGDDIAMTEALIQAQGAVGLFGWQSFGGLRGLQALPIAGVMPTAGTLSRGLYPMTQPQFLYTTPDALADPQVRSVVTQMQGPGADRPMRLYTTGSTAKISTVEERPTSRVRVYSTPD